MQTEKNVGRKLWLDPGEKSNLTQMLRICRELWGIKQQKQVKKIFWRTINI